MPSIKPVSDLRNYAEVLKEVDTGNTVYLTKNGYGAYAIMTVEKANELERLKAAYEVVSNLKQSEERANYEGWISDDEMRKVMGL